ncbi:MAG: hypothetical protein RDU20_03270 [Desulfomonilaceae bacterium]|nr:hypothetical protein [Desulfomonilaceae bacterium]
MILKRILNWAVHMVLGSLVAVPVVRAEQPIILPLILVVPQAASGAVSEGGPRVRTAVYTVPDVGAKSYSTEPDFCPGTTHEGILKSLIRSDDHAAHRIELHTLNHVRSGAGPHTELHVPVVLKIVLNGGMVRDISICRPSDLDGIQNQRAATPGAVIPAVDLVTGEPTVVRPEYVTEYRSIAGPDQDNDVRIDTLRVCNEMN